MGDRSQQPLIIIAANRGPFSFTRDEEGEFTETRGAGGLITALGPLAQQHEVIWVASALSEDDEAWANSQGDHLPEVDGIFLKLIVNDAEEYNRYYNQIANPLLWFIQHQLWDVPRNPVIDAQTWEAWTEGYIPVNKRFAETIASVIADTDRPVIILPQDYHLYLVPSFLRKLIGQRALIQPFVHIPWPGPDAWRILPGEIRDLILQGMLSADILGFQTEKDAFNWVQTCRFYLRDAHAHGTRDTIRFKEHSVEARAYPISIDVAEVESLIEDPETLFFKSQFVDYVKDRKLILRVDRVEPSKNILRGLEAFRTLLVNHPEHHGQVAMLALLVPSRMEVSEYQDYLGEIMAMAGMINADFSDSLWEPVRIIVGDNYKRALAAMQLYDVLLVNPIADGMNLVAKEGALVNQKNGVLVLSEHAGAFYELGDEALSVSPFDVYGTAIALQTALTMVKEERFERTKGLQSKVRHSDVNRWFQAQVEDALNFERHQDKNDSTPETDDTVKSA